ncbi:MAG: methyltransferase domain-containing protein [Pseudomonadota bacterium]
MKHEIVKTYYGETLQSSADLQTDACCTDEAMPEWLKPVLSKVHDEVMMRYYGCGLIAPEALSGARILDLGCGTGRDVYALSALVGPKGEVVGVDMTDAQLDVARAHQDYHREVFGLPHINTAFHKGLIENLGDLGLEPGSFDVVVSNCVVNLAEDKGAVLRGVYDLLKPGGEMYFSDVYASRRIPQALRDDDVLYGECLSGALYINDFLRLARETGFDDPRQVKARPLTIQNPALAAKLAQIGFSSRTYRLFKLEGLEPLCEDYGQAVIYKGTIEHAPDAFMLDDHHMIETGKVFSVCGNTWKMLRETRLAPHFDFIGDFSTHYGVFDGCAPGDPAPQELVSCC